MAAGITSCSSATNTRSERLFFRLLASKFWLRASAFLPPLSQIHPEAHLRHKFKEVFVVGVTQIAAGPLFGRPHIFRTNSVLDQKSIENSVAILSKRESSLAIEFFLPIPHGELAVRIW